MSKRTGYDKIPRNNIKMIINDMSAKIYKEPEFMGKIELHSHYMRKVTKTGKKRIDFTTSKNMIAPHFFTQKHPQISS